MARILVTGATGFVGARFVEVAFDRGHTPVCLVRTWARAARLARMPVALVQGDVLDVASLAPAMKACDLVVHCAVDNRLGGRAHRRSSARGTENVMRAALQAGVRRVVHISSTAVYGYSPGPSAASEMFPSRFTGDAYCDGKIDAERVALGYHRRAGLPVVVIRPSLVYGPFSPLTTAIAQAIRAGRMVLVDGGHGICNALYIDNLIDAIFLAAERDGAVGEVFHVADGQTMPWRRFIEDHARALAADVLPLPEMTGHEIATARASATASSPSSISRFWAFTKDAEVRRAARTIPAVERVVAVGRALARSALPSKVTQRIRKGLATRQSSRPSTDEPRGAQVLAPFEVDMFSTFQQVSFSIDKARRVLGYEPRVGAAEGMASTAAWMAWAQL